MNRLISLLAAILVTCQIAIASPVPQSTLIPVPNPRQQPALTITPPNIKAKAYLLMDAKTGKVLAESNADLKLPPASLTKMMTMYVISDAIDHGQIKLDDTVHISDKAWRAPGSRMFVKLGANLPVNELIQGIIVVSGNDACIAMAEHVAGTEEAFTNLMNQEAQRLKMTNTHYTDSTGLPHPNHYTTARDLATLARSIVENYPEDYQWYKQKWFSHNGIKQPNRNRLLWRMDGVDGIKTGHTNDAGFCLAASGLANGMRLITIVLGAPTDAARADDAQRLLTYGFRFFESHKLYEAHSPLANPRIWFGKNKTIPVGLANDFYVTVPRGQYGDLKASLELDTPLKAPIVAGQQVGKVAVLSNGDEVAQAPVFALEADPQGGLFSRLTDRISLAIDHLLGSDDSNDTNSKG